jgi:hypothetical protein
MKALIEYCARRLVDNPEGVHVDEHETGETTVFTLRVMPGDLGKVIGREGAERAGDAPPPHGCRHVAGSAAPLEIAD